jgi:mono/diheme cytochrome c family protein
MKARAAFTLLALLAVSVAAVPAAPPAADIEHGKALHDKSCLSCHDTKAYTAADRKIETLDALDQRVHMCTRAAAVAWSKNDVADVIAYLNSSFYKFTGKERVWPK